VVAPDERRDRGDAEQRRRVDHRAQVVAVDAALVRVGRERVGVVAQRRDGDAGALDEGAHPRGRVLVEPGDVDMGDAGVPPLGPSLGPAHHLHAVEAVVGRGLENLFEREIRQDSAHKA